MTKFTTLLTALLLLCGVWAQAQIWSETFADSLDGWTLEDHSLQQSGDVWTWTNIGPQGPYSIGPIESTTASDGWVIFDSDLLCSGSQNAWLISPTIDLSGHDTVVLFFEQYYAVFFSQTFVQVSNDDGATWTAIEVNQELGINEGTENPSVVEIDISQYVANSATARIAFQYLSDDPDQPLSGCGYSWQIDDIRLESQGTPPPPPNTNIVWGGPGDPNSEFDGGLNDWTAVGITYPDANWVWEADGKADQGAFSTGTGTLGILSPSVANGAMVFDSDFYDNGGDPNNIGGGPYPAPQVAELISPVMDLEGEEALAVEFNQYTRNFQSTYAVAWSDDGGATWSDPIFFNQDIGVNEQSPRNDVVRVPLKYATGTSQFRIKFIYEANYYFWIIDDVKIVRRTNHEMRINDWYAIAPNYQTPVTQREPFGFLADIENVGAYDETNVKLHMVIRQVGGDTVYTDFYDYGTIARDSLAENQSFGNFLPPDMTGIYRAEYVLEYDSIQADEITDNNEVTFFFEVSDSTFAKEDGGTRTIYPAAANWEDPNEPRSWAYGNYYHVVEGGMVASSASFALGNAGDVPGELVYLSLYKWTDTDGDAQCDPDERELVGINFYEIQGNEVPIVPVTVGLTDFNDDPVILEANTDYVLMLEYVADDNTTEVEFVASDEFDYGAMILNSAQMGAPRYASMLGINGDLTVEPYSSIGFGWDLVPVVRLNVTELPNATNEALLHTLETRIAPNPASDVVHIALPDSRATDAELRLINTQGQMVLFRQTRLGAGQQASLDVRDLPTGTYFLLIRTEEGLATRKLQIAH